MAEQADLTHEEASAAFKALGEQMGSRADWSAGLNRHSSLNKAALTATFWPNGLCSSSPQFFVFADTYRELLAASEEAWAERSDLHAINTIRDMALAIIRITAERGECTDASLRAEFDAADVTRFAERAVESANEMASNGPFSITKLSGANDAEAA